LVVVAKSCQLFVAHLGHLKQLSVLIGSNELFDDHETTTDTNDQLSIEDLCINLFRAEQVESISKLLDWYKTIGLVDVVAKHLIQEISLWHVEDWFLRFLSDSSVHDLNDLILISEEHLDFFDVIDLLSNSL